MRGNATMSEWRLPDEMIARGEKVLEDWRWSSSRAADVFEAMAGACGTCQGDGYLRSDMADIDEPCEACHGTGLAGVEWRCRIDRAMDEYRCSYRDPEPHKGCGLVLVIPLDRSG